ncbi:MULTISPECIES: Fic family protein [unclassified Treponema]|uniref:Fic family protein n=1 Tax=unclassified Treponema TaxID=2638727 RepID=UPI0020A600E8|nr:MULTISPECIES: Fic family protein [unclassified Treponema]UTC67098.1 Fic family protein [Treponema sp. OMZ 789]UTC69829.1 Fic family protein [Treponema sp. OMZ 790]UTC72543.1 Fic family protein [Treponema sp. OMZ 791]
MLERPPVSTKKVSQIAFNPEIEKLNRGYPYWDKVKYFRLTDTNPEEAWFAIKNLRRINRTFLKFGKYKFGFTVNDEIMELLHYFDMNIGGGPQAAGILPYENKNAFLTSSIMEEAIASSQMEGAATTRKVAKNMLRKKEKPKNKDQQMIVNNYQTINYIKENVQENFSIKILKDIHYSMTKNTLDNENDSGHFRKHNNIIIMDGLTGETAHYPPDYQELKNLISDLEKFFNGKDKTFIHPIIRAVIIHFMLSYIHPFSDGNGRTARSLFYWYMIKNGYQLIEYMPISRIIYKTKRMYEKAFLYTEYDENDLTYFIMYNLITIKKAFEDMKLYITRKIEENKTAFLLSHIKGINERQSQIIQIVQENPDIMLTVREIESRFAVSNFTARSDLEGLVRLEFLSEIHLNKVKRAYVKSNLRIEFPN